MKIQDPKEDKLLDELETLYQRVAESEKSEVDSEPIIALQSYYESLQVAPDASMETIKENYEQLADFWDPQRFADDPSLRENAERKLTNITHAYEKILASRQREKGPCLPESPRPFSGDPGLSAPNEETGHDFPRGKVLLGGVAFVVLVLAVFFWPDFYHYHRTESENLTDQVKKNRTTDRINYFDGENARHDPVLEAKSSAPSAAPAPVPPAQSSTLPVEQPNPGGAAKPASLVGPKITGQEKAPAEKQSGQETKIIGYTIQVSAVRDLNMAKKFVETQKRNGVQVYLAEIKVKDQGVWHRVYLGRFAGNADAARYMEEKKIRKLFPNSFIRKLS
jgi:cell division septation protein DedD